VLSCQYLLTFLWNVIFKKTLPQESQFHVNPLLLIKACVCREVSLSVWTAQRTSNWSRVWSDTVVWSIWKATHTPAQNVRLVVLTRALWPGTCTRTQVNKSLRCLLPVAMAQHTRIMVGHVAGLKPYSCTRCNKQFSRKYHLERHIVQTGCDGNPRPTHPCQVVIVSCLGTVNYETLRF
jgi:uncharacterized Zn-finger protein